MELMQVQAPYTLQSAETDGALALGGGGQGVGSKRGEGGQDSSPAAGVLPGRGQRFLDTFIFLSDLNCGESILGATVSESALGES